MNTYRQILYHIIFCTHNRQNSLPTEHHKEQFKYIWGIIKNKQSKLYRINGTENHIHILSDLHQSIALADFIKDIKGSSSKWMKGSGKFVTFIGWASGYCALTYSIKEKNTIIEYIKNQKEHHKTISFEDEYLKHLKENGIEFEARHVF
jgi:REP element-mobilizing transposase RayT